MTAQQKQQTPTAAGATTYHPPQPEAHPVSCLLRSAGVDLGLYAACL